MEQKTFSLLDYKGLEGAEYTAVMEQRKRERKLATKYIIDAVKECPGMLANASVLSALSVLGTNRSREGKEATLTNYEIIDGALVDIGDSLVDEDIFRTFGMGKQEMKTVCTKMKKKGKIIEFANGVYVLTACDGQVASVIDHDAEFTDDLLPDHLQMDLKASATDSVTIDSSIDAVLANDFDTDLSDWEE